MPSSVHPLFGRGSWPEVSRITAVLRRETVGGALVLVATVLAMIWANSPWAPAYAAVRELTVGPAAVHLDLSLATWAADGLLAVFFLVVGLELKREFVAGDLRDPQRAVLPIAAAVGGMLVPALVYVGVNLLAGSSALRGWAIPTATDIAFALAVLALVSTHLPAALRTFLLTLAVVDDLLAITIIALFYTSDLQPLYLLLAAVPLAAFTLCVQRRVTTPWLLVPLGLATWVLVHESGVHATVAGVLLGFAVPVLARRGGPAEHPSPAERFEHALRPLSSGFAVPVFALLAAGVTLGGPSRFAATLQEPVALGIILGLLVGKGLGVFLAAYLVARFTNARLDDDLSWLDILGMSVLAGIGFTVSLLIGGLAFADAERQETVKVAVLAGSVLAALVAAVILKARDRVYRQICEREETDDDEDGVPDVYQTDRSS